MTKFSCRPDPYRNTGKTCLCAGMHCPSASSYQLGRTWSQQLTSRAISTTAYNVLGQWLCPFKHLLQTFLYAWH